MALMDSSLRYRMPAHFGPTPGPRQGPDGKPFDWAEQPLRTLVSTSFLSSAEAIQSLLPEGFVLDGEPVVTIEIQYWTQLAWLAGRGYNTFGVKFPVKYRGRKGPLHGPFLAVLWENMPDAIISGREELGYNKLFAEIPSPQVFGGRQHYSANWFGHEFFKLELSDIEAAPLDDVPRAAGDGILHHKYIPKTGESGSDADYVTLTPLTGGKTRYTQYSKAKAKVQFVRSTWNQIPTLYHIVNALSELPIRESRGSFLAESVGAKDLSDQVRVSW